jgi:hypothetical protein
LDFHPFLHTVASFKISYKTPLYLIAVPLPPGKTPFAVKIIIIIMMMMMMMILINILPYDTI